MKTQLTLGQLCLIFQVQRVGHDVLFVLVSLKTQLTLESTCLHTSKYKERYDLPFVLVR